MVLETSALNQNELAICLLLSSMDKQQWREGWHAVDHVSTASTTPRGTGGTEYLFGKTSSLKRSYNLLLKNVTNTSPWSSQIAGFTLDFVNNVIIFLTCQKSCLLALAKILVAAILAMDVWSLRHWVPGFSAAGYPACTSQSCNFLSGNTVILDTLSTWRLLG